jgi:hypothetical protein
MKASSQFYRIESKAVSLVVSGSDTRDAFRKFMRSVIRDGSWKNLGMVAIIRSKDESEQVAMRTVDALVLLGCMTEEEGLANIQQVGDFEMDNFQRMLEQSHWILEGDAAAK